MDAGLFHMQIISHVNYLCKKNNRWIIIYANVEAVCMWEKNNQLHI